MSKQSIEILNKIKSSGYWKVVIRPTDYKKERIPLPELQNIIQQCQVRQRGWSYPIHTTRTGDTFHGDNYLSSFVDWNEFTEVWRFYQSGKFTQFMKIHEDGMAHTPYSEGKVLGVILALYTITEIFIFAKNLASKDIVGDSIHIEIELHGTGQRKLIMGEPLRHLHDNYICQVDKLEVFSGNVPVTKLLADYADIAMDVSIKTFNKFNWLNPEIKNVIKRDQDKLLKGFF